MYRSQILYLMLIVTFLFSQLKVATAQSDSSEKPNIIFILLDDVGFSDLGAYGSEISTPNMDQLAQEGLRYNFFDSRAICSPTRAALLTGRNNQSVGMMDLAGGDPDGPAHSRGYVTPEAATVGQILQQHGYLTTITGKWHLTPSEEFWDWESDNAPSTFVNWPSEKGFDNFYGILSGWTDQFNPSNEGPGRRMKKGNAPVEEAYQEDYHFSEAIVEHAIDFMKDGFEQSPDQPQFLFLSFGAAHAPIQVPLHYADRYKGVYDEGWDVIRYERFQRQKQLGIIPGNATLTPRHPEDPAWDTLPEVQQQVFTRFMEVYAGFLEHTDDQIGKFISFLKETGEYDNSLIFLMSDNGAAPEAGVDGNFVRPYGDNTTVEEMHDILDLLGTEDSSALYPRPWARVGNTPFQRYKLWPYAGGLRVPLIISWPGVITDSGTVRSQFVEMIDITPTVYDILNIEIPEEVGGSKQMKLHGSSILNTFADPNASTRTTQFYQMRGSRGIYHDGWRAVTVHEGGTSFEENRWELYNVEHDFSEAIDLSAQYPEKLNELIKLWWNEAERYGGLPLLEFRWSLR